MSTVAHVYAARRNARLEQLQWRLKAQPPQLRIPQAAQLPASQSLTDGVTAMAGGSKVVPVDQEGARHADGQMNRMDNSLVDGAPPEREVGLPDLTAVAGGSAMLCVCQEARDVRRAGDSTVLEREARIGAPRLRRRRAPKTLRRASARTA